MSDGVKMEAWVRLIVRLREHVLLGVCEWDWVSVHTLLPLGARKGGGLKSSRRIGIRWHHEVGIQSKDSANLAEGNRT